MIRFLDTAIAAGIVVLAHLLVPKQTWASRAATIMREACDATERYAREARSADRTELTAADGWELTEFGRTIAAPS